MDVWDCESATDEELAGEGEGASLSVLVRRYQGKIFRLGFRFLGDPKEAEEVLQDTFLKVIQNLSAFRGEAKFSTWIYRIACNEALMRLRSKHRHPTESLDEYLPQYNATGRLERLDLDYGRAARADELLESRELAEKALEAVQRLPEIYRAPLVLHDLEELSTEQTAQILNLTPALVRTRLHRARLILRGYLGHLAGGEE
jgi:RNA polymerase sigma-70 factor (ECF subfamily)